MGDLPEQHAPARTLQQIQSKLQETLQAALTFFNELQCEVFNTVATATLSGLSVENLQSLDGLYTTTEPTTPVFFLNSPRETSNTFLSKAI